MPKKRLNKIVVALIFGSTFLLLLDTTVFKPYTPVLWALSIVLNFMAVMLAIPHTPVIQNNPL